MIYDHASVRLLNSQLEFAVTENREREGIVLHDEQNSFPIEKDQLLDFWQFLRAAGYCKPNNFPAGLNIYAVYIISVLEKLDYVKPVLLSSSSDVSERQIGIQLIPGFGSIPNKIEGTITKSA